MLKIRRHFQHVLTICKIYHNYHISHLRKWFTLDNFWKRFFVYTTCQSKISVHLYSKVNDQSTIRILGNREPSEVCTALDQYTEQSVTLQKNFIWRGGKKNTLNQYVMNLVTTMRFYKFINITQIGRGIYLVIAIIKMR